MTPEKRHQYQVWYQQQQYAAQQRYQYYTQQMQYRQGLAMQDAGNLGEDEELVDVPEV
jgi:hypothetical protein